MGHEKLKSLLPLEWHKGALQYGFGGCSYLCHYWSASPEVRLAREDYLPDADGAAFVLMNALLSIAQVKSIDTASNIDAR